MAARARQLRGAARFTSRLYGGRARAVVDAHVRRNAFARLSCGRRPGPLPDLRADPGRRAVRDDAVRSSRDRRPRDLQGDPAGPALRRRAGGSGAARARPRPLAPRPATRPTTPACAGWSRRRSARAGWRTSPSLIEKTVGAVPRRRGRAGTFDLMPALAAPLPIAVINRLLGIPEEDGALLAATAWRSGARCRASARRCTRVT